MSVGESTSQPTHSIQLKPTTNSTQHVIAGAGSGFFTRALCQPFDILKIRFQLQIEPIKRDSQLSKYRSLPQATITIFKEEGYKAFWKGHIPAQALSIVYTMVQFSSFELYSKKLCILFGDEHIKHQTMINFLSGSMAGCSAMLLAYPFDVIRTRLISQSEPKIYLSVTDAFKRIYKKQGVRGLFLGLTPTLVQIAPFVGSQFAFYHICNNLWDKFDPKTNSNQIRFLEKTFISGAIAGVLAKIFVYPLDMIKKRLQVQGFEEARKCFGAVRTYNGAFDCIKKVVKEEKFWALYKGLGPSVIKAGFATALNFTFYQEILNLIS